MGGRVLLGLSLELLVLLQLLHPMEHADLGWMALPTQAPEALRKEDVMGIILLVLLLALIFGGLGFAIHALWIVAVVLFVVWVVAFALGRGRSKSARAS